MGPSFRSVTSARSSARYATARPPLHPRLASATSGTLKSKDLTRYDHPIQDQGWRNTCTVFASLAAYERWQNLPAVPTKLSPQHLTWLCNGEKAGSLNIDTLKIPFEILVKQGCALAADWEYDLVNDDGVPPTTLTSQKLGKPKRQKVDAYHEDFIKNLKLAMDHNRFVAVMFETFKNSWTIARCGDPDHNVPADGNVKKPKALDPFFGKHAVCLVGYSDSTIKIDGGGRFIFRNSQNDFASDAAHPGYGSISYDYIERHCEEAFYFY